MTRFCDDAAVARVAVLYHMTANCGAFDEDESPEVAAANAVDQQARELAAAVPAFAPAWSALLGGSWVVPLAERPPDPAVRRPGWCWSWPAG